MWILHFQCLASSAFGLPREGLNTSPSCPWKCDRRRLVVHSPSAQLAFLLPKGTDAAAVRWDKYNGVNAAKHLGDFLVWHI